MRRCLKDCRHFFVALAISLSLTLLGADFLVQRNTQMRIAELQSVITLQIDKLTSSLTKYFGSCLAERFFSEHFENEFVNVLVSVVKTKLAFFQMKVKSVFCQPSKAHKARLGEGPEAFNAINM